MAKTHEEKIKSVQEQIQQLESQRKKLIGQKNEQDRKARTRRLIERGAILESLIDGADALTNDQIKAQLQAALGVIAVAPNPASKPVPPSEG